MRRAPEGWYQFLSAMRVTRFLKILRRPTAGNASNGGGDDSYRKNGTLSLHPKLALVFHALPGVVLSAYSWRLE
jgi:hypothetical protein